MIDKSRARLVAKGYSQVEEVDYFDTFALTASTTSNRLVAEVACKLDWDRRRLDIDEAFIRSELDTKNFFRLPPGCGRLSGKVVGTQQSSLWDLAEWPLVVSATIINLGRVWC